jgi:hypothetical protein
MTDQMTTETVPRGSWQVAFDDALAAALRTWAEKHVGDLDEQVDVMMKQAGDRSGGWYGHESSFSYALRWRAEDLMKAEVSTYVAQYVLSMLDGTEHVSKVDTPQRILELVAEDLKRPQAEGLRSSSSSEMANTLTHMRGYAALEFGGQFDSLERLTWEAHYKALKVVSELDGKRVHLARTQLREAKMALDRTRSENGKAREQRKVDLAEANLTLQLQVLEQTLRQAGAPDSVVEMETKRDRGF